MKVNVTVQGAQAGQPSDVQITADATVTVGDVATALAGSDRLAGQWPAGRALTLRLVRERATTLLPDLTLLESGVRSGDTLAIAHAEEAAAERDTAPTAAVLRVVSGPDAGREFALPLGASTIGRAPDCDVRLSDPKASKLHARVVVSSRAEIIDSGSANGVVVGGVRLPRVVLATGEVAELGDSLVEVRLVSAVAAQGPSTDVGYLRPPVVLDRPVEREVELPEPPRPQNGGRFPVIALLAPLAMGGVYLATRLTGSGGSGGSAIALLFLAMSPLLLVGNYVDQRLQRRRTLRQEVETFTTALEARRTELAAAHERERRQLRTIYPELDVCLAALNPPGSVLWSRRPEHPEFLQLRLGLGDITPLTTAEAPRPGGLAEHHDQARTVAEAFGVLNEAPVVADLRSVGGVGVCGDPALSEPVARAVTAQVAALHSPSEVVMACLTNVGRRARWEWLQWLPHTASPHSPLAVHLAADPGAGALVLNQLEELVAARSGGVAPQARGPLTRSENVEQPTVPSVVVVVDETSVDIARLSRVAESGPDVGVYVLWVADRREGLPGACRTFVDVRLDQASTVGMVRRGETVARVQCEGLDRARALSFARRMAPLFDAGAPVEDQSDLPRSVSVVSLYGHDAADDAEVVLTRWRENESLVARDRAPVSREREADLVAVVGHAASEPFTLDLRRQGPHALVGGTTGAGKSEFLQSWVLGLAHAYSPDRLTFLFVDYKGGAAFATCTELPHCVGLVTDLSPYLVRRALRSLRAELHLRERILNAKGKKDLAELEKTGDPDCPPSLVIVVDEFAALVNEVPEFVDGVVDVAQRGRSLGLHLILATQRPAGVIKDNLRANTNLRIALRMADETDSLDVLGEKLAAHFPASIPGRAAAKTGPGRITQFQSAFPGARTPLAAEAPQISVVDLDFGPGRAWRMPERPKVSETVATDLVRVVTSVRSAARSARVPAPRKPWLEPLAPTYNLARLAPRRDTRIPLGIIDDPDRQAQLVEYYEPDVDGSILYFGGGGSGKSTALRSLAVAAAITPGGGVCHVYGLDFGGGSLQTLELLPNVGSIIGGDDEERVRRVLGHLSDVVEERSARYTRAKADTLAGYREVAGRPDEPRVLLLLDGFSAFRAAFEASAAHQGLYQQFQRLVSEGRSVGVHVAMTADRPSTVPSSILSAFSRRIVLRQTSDEAYLTLNVPRDVLGPTSPAGRAVQPDKPVELQLAVFLTEQHAQSDDTSAGAQASAIEALARDLREYPNRPAPVRSLPALVPVSHLPEDVGSKPVLGLADDTLAPVGFDATGAVMVAGPSQSGRTNAVHWLALSVRRWFPDVSLVHLSARRTPLSALELWSRSAQTQDDVSDLLADLEQVVTQPAGARPVVAVFVEFLPEFIGTPVEQPLLRLIQQCRRNGHLVVAEGETSSWSAPWPLAMEVRNGRVGLLLQPDQVDGETLLRTPLPRVRRSDLPAGRGFWVAGGRARLLQVPLAEDWSGPGPGGHPPPRARPGPLDGAVVGPAARHHRVP